MYSPDVPSARHDLAPLNDRWGANPEAAKRAGEVVKALADEAYADLAPIVAELRSERLSLRQIADRLNQDGHTTRRGRPWSAVQVKRVIERAGS